MSAADPELSAANMPVPSTGKDATPVADPSPTGTSSATPTMTNAPPSPLQAALDFWRQFNLNDRRAELDTQGLAIADRQEASTSSRKQLSVDTRNFRKTMSENKQVNAKEVGPLLKAYQAEIDSLTNRAKSAETSFISLYKALYDAPDPVEMLSQAMRDAHLVLQLREQISSMKEERGELFERSANTSILEKRISDLEADLRQASKRAKDEAHALLEQEQSQWMAAQQKTIEAYEMREQELLHQVSQANDTMRRMQGVSDDMQQQLNESRSELEHLKSTRASVNDMAVEDLERTRAEANSLRRRCTQLENRLAGRADDEDVDAANDVSSSIGPSALSAELAARDVQISQLRDQVSTLEEVLGGKDQEKRNEFAKLSNSITEKDAELTDLKSKLNRLPSIEEYETMKRQFETLQSFQMLDAMETEVTNAAKTENGQMPSDSQDGATTDTLEKRLLNKVKTLESRLTKLRVDLSERDAKISDLKSAVRRFEDQVADQKALITKLEDGINVITGEKGSMHALKRRAAAASKGDTEDGMTDSATASGGVAVGGGGGDGNQGDDDDDQSAWDWGDKHQAEGLENIISEEPSMLDIIAGQRDRFRARTLELEEDNRKLMERIEKVTGDVESLKNDNVKLYEKVRFVQSYRQTNGVAPAASAVPTHSVEIGVGTVDDEEDGSVLGKYKSMYEDMVNPYTIFNRRERHKRLNEMSAPERLTLRASQKALSTKTSRLVVFFYIIALHVLVFLVIGFSSTMCESESVTTKARH